MEIATFKQLNKMLDRGVIGVMKKPKPFFPFGFRGGAYLGSPGKDIFFLLSDLSDDQLDALARRLSELYPHKPPRNHVKWAACIRYVYGCFEKQGCLRSKKDMHRMVEEDADWSIPMRFMEKVKDYFVEKGNKYGLILHYEMLGHRWGDRSIIKKDKSLLGDMSECYKLAASLAKGIKSWKHTFTPWYWGGHYYYTVGDKDNAKIWYTKCLKRMNKYCPDSRDGYREKARTALKHLKSVSSESEWKSFCKWYKKSKNVCLRKVKIR